MSGISTAACMSTRAASQIMASILVVGGGLTSGATSALLSAAQNEATTKPFNVSVWDKAQGVGGRMSTSRSPSNPNCTADLGAQYITATPQYLKEHKKFYDELKIKGLIAELSSNIEGRKPSEPGTLDFVMPKGSSSIVKHFFHQSGLKVQFNHFVENIKLSDNKWAVTTKEGKTDLFDCVVMTMPTPQILQVAREVLEGKPELKRQLESVQFSSRYGLALFYDSDKSDSVTLDGNVAARYINDDHIFRFVSIDNIKRNAGKGSATSVVFHTSVPYGVKNVEQTVEQVQPELVAHFEKMFPHWPKPDKIKGQKWRYSQVVQAFPNSPGCVVLNENPLLIAGGDGFVHSNVDGCLKSSQKIVDVILEKLSSRGQ